MLVLLTTTVLTTVDVCSEVAVTTVGEPRMFVALDVTM